MPQEFPFNEYHSLLQLDPDTWEHAEPEDAEMAGLLKRVVNKPVRRLVPGELLPLLRRGLSLEFVAPLAIAALEDNPFLQAESHPGDLLVAALESNPAFWATRRALWEAMMLVLGEAATQMEAARENQELGDYYPHFVGEDFMGAVLHFSGLHDPKA